ncbi:cytochrome P450 [Actinomadura verrucosospora]
MKAVAALPGKLRQLANLASFVRDPLAYLSRESAGAPVSRINLPGPSVFVVNDVELIRRILIRDVAHFDKGAQYDRLRPLLGDAVSLARGPAHRDRRRLLQPVFHHDRVDSYTTLMRAATLEAVDGWKDGEIVAVDDAMRSISLNVAARTLCSTVPGERTTLTVQQDLPRILNGLTWRALNPFPVLERIPLPGNQEFGRATRRLRRDIAELVAKRSRQDRSGDDLIHLLIRAYGDDAEAQARVCDDAINLLLAGTETTGNALCWVWHLLAGHPQVEARVHLAATEGDGEYLGWVIKEALRIYPPAWLIPRRVVKALNLGPCELPVGSLVFFSPYLLHRSPEIYESADAFRPERWEPGASPAPSPHAFLTFGAGPHNCIGARFATTEMIAVVQTIAERYRLLPAGETAVRPSATLVPTRLHMRVERRQAQGRQNETGPCGN